MLVIIDPPFNCREDPIHVTLIGNRNKVRKISFTALNIRDAVNRLALFVNRRRNVEEIRVDAVGVGSSYAVLLPRLVKVPVKEFFPEMISINA